MLAMGCALAWRVGWCLGSQVRPVCGRGKRQGKRRFVMTLQVISLASVTDWDGFTHAIRALQAQGAPPAEVRWEVAGGEEAGDLFAQAPPVLASTMPKAPALSLPRTFVSQVRAVFLHHHEGRFALLHRLIARISLNTLAWQDPLDPDRLALDRLHREVRREIHKMHAFVRFRQVLAPGPEVLDKDSHGVHDNATAAGEPLAPVEPEVRHVAWFEPAHHIVEAAAPFFVRRFANMKWAILTPRVSVEWDGRSLRFGPGGRREEAPDADAGEALWLAYYQSIFNPARVKVAMMKKEMPVRFWKNLPESTTIAPLLCEAPERQRTMIEAQAQERVRRRPRVPQSSPPIASISASTLAELKQQAMRCRDCPVADITTQTVFGEGNEQAQLMLVGEQPGDQEDLAGRPFHGPAGQLLQGALDELGWDRKTLYLTNAVKHFHYEMRGKKRMHMTPSQQAAQACLHWLEKEIALVKPSAIIALGATAAQSLLGQPVPILANEGAWFVRSDGMRVLICRHPSSILRADPAAREALRTRWIESMRLADPKGVMAEAVHIPKVRGGNLERR